MFKKTKLYIKLLILISILVLAGAWALMADTRFIAQKGVLDLQDWNFEKQGLVPLTGEWEVYWDQFIKPGDFESYKENKKYFQVTGHWGSEHIDNKETGHHGFATFRLFVNADRQSSPMQLIITSIISNFAIYVNGRLVSEYGNLQKTEDSIPDRRHPRLSSLDFSGDELEIVVHVSNYKQVKAGIYREIYLAPSNLVQKNHHKLIGFELILFGGILLIGVYHLVNFFFRKKAVDSLFFSLLCFLFSLRILFMGSRFANLLFPELSYEFSLFIEYSSVYLALPVFSLFLFYLYPEEFSSNVLKMVVVVSAILFMAIIPFYEVVYTLTLMFFEIFAILVLLYISYVLILAIKNGRAGAKIVACGFVLLFISAVNDILFEKNLIATGYYLATGLMGYILFQALQLSQRSALQFSRNEELSGEPAQINSTLEHRVKGRTAELKKRNKQLQTEIDDHEKTAEELATAKLLAEQANYAKSEFLANMSHELRTPMHGILGFAKFGEDKIDKVGKETLLEYFTEIKMCGERLLILLNDLLDLSKLESGKIIYDFQPNDLCDVVDTVMKEFVPVAKQKLMELDFQSPESGNVADFDEGKMIQVVRNLVSNAIKFSPEKSKIKLMIDNQNESLSLAVVDRGVGIPQNELKDVFDKFVQSSKTKTASGGTGLGLPISQKIIFDHKGDIWAANNVEGGATFTFTIPKIQKAKKKLGEILVEQNLITRLELVKTLKSQEEDN